MISHLNTLFITMLLMSTALVMIESSWFTAWIGLELNLLVFIPMLTSPLSRLSAESAIKYFLTQVIASIIFISMMIFFYAWEWSLFPANWIMQLALLMKL